MIKVRCAIYTRKSSEEGLEQGFNSLDAQREACAAYILSQASQGWEQLPDLYDDGGLSGGTLERPALQRLLVDVAAGRIDIIVVYKVDRLTRSLLDFARLVEAFDKSNVSFVSITQSFNTTTSMGRLTLNMLLSFAQFEREVTAERIRDKIAASKAKGMWMGGTPPLGYAPEGRTLRIVEDHSDLVRDIYARYLDLGNVRILAEQLAQNKIFTPSRTTGSGRKFGGVPFTRGQIYAILKNPIYVGGIPHRGTVHPGQHPPIIARDLWQQVQERLAAHARGERRIRVPNRSLLAGRVVDAQGEPLIATHACKGKQRYRYYVSRDAHHGVSTSAALRIPAREIEGLVAQQIAALFDDPIALIGMASLTPTPDLMAQLDPRARSIAQGIRASRPQYVAELVSHVRVEAERVEIDIATNVVAGLLAAQRSDDAPATITLTIYVRMTRTGRVVRLVHQDGRPARISDTDPALIRLLGTAQRWWAILRKGEINIDVLSRREGVTASWMTRVVRLAFLSPQLVDAILAATIRPDTSGDTLLKTDAVPACWKAQRTRYLTPTS